MKIWLSIKFEIWLCVTSIKYSDLIWYSNYKYKYKYDNLFYSSSRSLWYIWNLKTISEWMRNCDSKLKSRMNEKLPNSIARLALERWGCCSSDRQTKKFMLNMCDSRSSEGLTTARDASLWKCCWVWDVTLHSQPLLFYKNDSLNFNYASHIICIEYYIKNSPKIIFL